MMRRLKHTFKKFNDEWMGIVFGTVEATKPPVDDGSRDKDNPTYNEAWLAGANYQYDQIVKALKQL